MTRDDKHALFAAAALNALIAADQAKPTKERPEPQSLAIDAAWFADQLIREVEKK